MEIRRGSEQVMRDLLFVIRSQALGMWRFRWVAMGFAWLICIGGWIAVYSMPNKFEANARVYVDTENAIEDFLGGIASPTDVMSEVTVVVREIVSRPNLAEVAHSTDLALRARTPAQFEDLLTSLQNRIQVSGNREGVYSISFEDTDRLKALAVVDALLTEFVEESLGADRSDSAQAQQFLQSQIAEYEQRLTAAEDRLAQFKRDNVALMPDQRGDYFSRLQGAEAALRSTTATLRLAEEKRAELLRQIEGEEPTFGIMAPLPTDGGSGIEAKIRELELQVGELRLRYTDKHPQIGQLLSTIEQLRQQQAQNAMQAGPATRSQQQNPLDMNPVYQNMRIQLTNVEVEIAALRAEQTQGREDVARLRRSVDVIPQVEAELNRLDRDYNVVRAKHQQLLQQLETANIGEDVSRSIDEVQFRVIDPPFADLAPVGPNRPLFLTAVLIMAFAAAGGLAFLLNQLKPTFIGGRSVTEALGIPVLTSVSLLLTEEQRRRERRSFVGLQAAAVLLVISFFAATTFSDQGSIVVKQLAARIL